MENVIIIGSGPAGLTAAIYTARANLAPLVIAGYEAGGQLMLTTEVENYPGFARGIMGPILMDEMRSQAERFGARFIEGDVTEVDFSGKAKKVWVEKESYEAHSIIVATGASAMWLNLDSEQRLRGRGVSSCATCDGAFFREKDVVVVGGGDVAMEDSLFLTKFARSVSIVHRRNSLRASKVMVERARKNPKINFIWNSAIEEVLGEGTVEGVRLRNVVTGELTEKPIQGLFVAIGHSPNTGIFKGHLDIDERGYIKTTEETHSNVPGIFIAGDVFDFRYRQAITAAGSGCKAAMDVEHYLAEIEDHDEATGEAHLSHSQV